MSDAETRFHETWIGMAQPIQGLVVSVPILVEAQCAQRLPLDHHRRFLDLAPKLDETDERRHVTDLDTFLAEVLDLAPDLFDRGDDLSEDLAVYVQEGRQNVRPTLALRKIVVPPPDSESPDATPASHAGRPYVMLVWDLPDGLPLDKPETETGAWDYPPAAKFERLLRRCRVPIGLVTNRRVFRLVYAPHGESPGAVTFRLDDMASTGGRPLLDAFVMLLSGQRFFGVSEEHQLPRLLEASRKRQANVTNEIAAQVFVALETLLRGFEAAAERDVSNLLDEKVREDDDHVYGGLLTVLLRLVFVLYAEDKDLLPTGHKFYAENFSVFGLFDELQKDYGAFPDSMDRRFGAWARLVALFRAIWLGAAHGDFVLPPRRGQLFDPHAYPFLEGWSGGAAPITQAENRAAVHLPSIDDLTVYRMLEKLVLFEGQRLSYATLDVEQIGSVYEALMGYHVVRMFRDAVCLRPSRTWVQAEEVLEVPKARRAKWLQETAALQKSHAGKLAKALGEAATEEEALVVLEGFRMKGSQRARAGRLVIQPGTERRRTSSHYTPRSLSAPIVERTLEPLLKTMGSRPASERILRLKVCDPAMGSGAFLVEACRYLADRVEEAWAREGVVEEVAAQHGDVLNHARRLVAQRCLYGVDKNPYAVNLAKLSLWLVTMSRDLPFTFLDHALRHGDSLVGLDFEQIRGFHWKPDGQQTLCSKALQEALDDAIGLRQKILELAESEDPADQREKERLLEDAEDALKRVRLIGDLVVGAFFAGKNDKERKKELGRRLTLVNAWLESDRAESEELRGLQAEILERSPTLHWMVEFPEVFFSGRPDPLEDDEINRAAFLDAFIGNPPFLGGRRISTELGDEYSDWLSMRNEAGKNGDLSAHFFRQADRLLGIHGSLGLIATNTIAQGDTRTVGLKALLTRGHFIYDATRSLLWPGEAAVAVSVVHTAKGRARLGKERYLDGLRAAAINSRLRPKPERPDPATLAANFNLSFQGSIIVGSGFTLTPDERDALIAKAEVNAGIIFPYLGGEEVNSSPTQEHHRYVINFGEMDLEMAAQWPDLLEIVRTKVKPARDRVKREAHRKYWWHFGDKRPALYKAIGSLERCLVVAIISKHLMFSFQPSGRIYSHKLNVFPLDKFTHFAILQSRAHRPWAWLLSSTMKNDLNYSASNCFDTFPFPQQDPCMVVSELETIGEHLYETRATYMLDTQQGLTQTYNHLKDPTCHDPRIEELRRLHEDMDRAVLDAYGWSDIDVPPYVTPTTDAERRALEAFEDEVIDRLFVLNEKRAEEERVLGLVGGKKKGGKKPRKVSKGGVDGQLKLL